MQKPWYTGYLCVRTSRAGGEGGADGPGGAGEEYGADGAGAAWLVALAGTAATSV